MANPTEDDLRVAKEVTPQFQYEPDGQYAKRVRRVASAIAAEREKAAKIAEEHKPWKFKQGGPDPHYMSCKGCGEYIAAAIRAGDKEITTNG